MDIWLDLITTVLLLPLQLILIPIDMFLNLIPNIEIVPQAISAIVGYIGFLPSTLVYLLGLSPFLWNAMFLTFILYITIAPSIQMGKKVWAWVRP
jgi:hypothetical protein